ncbi:MAG TPA: twin-arginine translocation signal domain-containing protein [Anaerolineae bacterium]|nr:twin-arginine translocation signal domain-containing protein [Anaerolineae bacterium]
MSQPTDKRLSRRDALKLLGAAAGASVLANLPSKWSTPQLTAGVLPAHAQTTCTRIFQAIAATGAAGNRVWQYVEPSYVSQEGIFPASAAEFLAPPPSGWTVRWECKDGCLQIDFKGTWSLSFPDGTGTGVLNQTLFANLTTGAYGVDEPPEEEGCDLF